MQKSENDYELMYMIYQKDELAMQLLTKKYGHLIDSTISRIVYNRDVYQSVHDDFYQLGLIMLFECLENFNDQKSAKFSTFFVLCYERKLRNDLRGYYRQGMRPQDIVSFDTYVDAAGEFTLWENTESYSYELRGDYYYNYVTLQAQIADTIRDFSPIEQHICQLRQQGYAYNEIIEIVACGYKKVDNTLQKFKRKLLTLRNEYDRVIKD